MPILAVHHGRNLPEVCKVLDEGKGWFRANWRTAAVLVLIFGLALFLRVYFVYGLAFQLPHVNCDSIYTPTYSGGSDSYYWDRALCYSFQSGRDLGLDPMLNYPLGNQNPRPLFFVVSTLYFFLRALRTMGRKRWVENWFQRDSIVTGLRAFLKENRTSVLYALLARLSVCVIALAWQGWAYVSVILMVWFAAELFLGRFRNEDTMGTWILFTITLATPLLLAFQWYLVRGQIRVWFDVPVYLFLGAFVLGLAFTVTRDYPWTLVIPSTLIAGAVGLGVGSLVNPTLTNAFFTGAGYFVQSKVVTTIAEDQAPGMSQMILSFGLFTFGLTLVAVAYLVWQIPRRRDPAYNIAVIWALVAIFMAITAARF